jgi:hypothetical protein
MISRIFRSSRLPLNASAGRSRARTSCWVIVEPPRGRPSSVSSVAETNPAKSKPGFDQKSLSSIAVVASSSSGGMSVKSTSSRLKSPRRARVTLPVRSVTVVCWSKTRFVRVSFGSGNPWL